MARFLLVICWERSKFWAKLSDPLASFEAGVSGGIVNMARGEYALINLPQFFNPSLPAPVVIHSVPQPAIQPAAGSIRDSQPAGQPEIATVTASQPAR